MAKQNRANRARGNLKGSRHTTTALVALIALLAVGSLIGVRLAGALSDTEDAAVVVKDADGAVHEFALDEDATEQITSSAGANTIEIRDGRVRVKNADCPNLDCVHQGWIDSAGQQIVCLPHKLIIDIERDGASANGVDVMGR